MSLSFLFDGLLVVLLATTIVYAAILNRRLRALRQSEGEMKALLEEFNSSASKAEANLGQIKALAARGAADMRESGVELAALKQLLERGQALKDDLTFLVDRGETIADRLVDLVSEARAVARPGAVRASYQERAPVDLSAVPLTAPAAAGAPRTRKTTESSAAERDLLKALRAARPER
ncbi:MAG TPA: DUF6468 domain-containing protein [Alphaproteobacteria bacterium]